MLDAHRLALAPAGFDMALACVTGLHTIMPRQARSDDDAKRLLRVMAEDLAAYPADVLREACRQVRTREAWFPAIGTVVVLCDEICAQRLRSQGAALDLLRQLEAERQDALAPPPRRCTPEEAAEILERLGMAPEEDDPSEPTTPLEEWERVAAEEAAATVSADRVPDDIA